MRVAWITVALLLPVIVRAMGFDETTSRLVTDDGATLPAWLSIVPPLLAIGLALAIREVHIALFTGIWFGAFVAAGFDLPAVGTAFLRVVDTYLIDALTDPGHASIILFSMLIGGMVHIISQNGGMAAVVAWIARRARDARSAQTATWLMGLAIFFDDYANTLVVGHTMRPLTDRYRISREKLAWIVDSTAAPIASIGLISTWIGYQITEIDRGLSLAPAALEVPSGYGIFLSSLAYAFYPILTIGLIFLVVRTGRDIGPMREAEERAREAPADSRADRTDGDVDRWWLAVVPIAVLVLSVFVGLLASGWSARVGGSVFADLRLVVGAADPYAALLWGSMTALVVAIALTRIAGRDQETTMGDMLDGFRSMVPAVVILLLAWSLAAVIDVLQTADVLASVLPDSLAVVWLPAVVFPLAAVIAFSTGSSWGTMAILYPLVLPLALSVGIDAGDPVARFWPAVFNLVSVVLAGSVLGDHCSPISDTTIMSSMAADCNHLDHVRTQLPYAVLIGGISWIFGCVAFALGLPILVCWALAIGCVAGAVYLFGRPLRTDSRLRG